MCARFRLFPLLAKEALSQNPPGGGPLPALICFKTDFATWCYYRYFWHHSQLEQAVSPSSLLHLLLMFYHCNSKSVFQPLPSAGLGQEPGCSNSYQRITLKL